MDSHKKDIISPDEATSLYGLFFERARRSPDKIAYIYYKEDKWHEMSWGEMAHEVSRWIVALKGEGLTKGDRVGIWIKNSREWVMMDQAALALGLVVIPVYGDDRAENVAYLINDGGIKVLLIESDLQLKALDDTNIKTPTLKRLISLKDSKLNDERLRATANWLPKEASPLPEPTGTADDIATIVYTSGTTGNPKGVIISHKNILTNIHSAMENISIYSSDRFLSLQ